MNLHEDQVEPAAYLKNCLRYKNSERQTADTDPSKKVR
jgi:hypothetical protein